MSEARFDWSSVLVALQKNDPYGTGMLSLSEFKAKLQETIDIADPEAFKLIEDSGAASVKYADFVSFCGDRNVVPNGQAKPFNPPSRIVRRRRKDAPELGRFSTTVDGREDSTSLQQRSPSRRSDGLFDRQHPPLIQAAGHKSSMLPDADPTFILKPFDEIEARNYEEIWSRADEADLQKFVGQYGGVTEVEILQMQVESHDALEGSSSEKRKFMRITNLIYGFNNPCVLDCKLGVRTFSEREITTVKQRPDLYKKLLEFAPEELTEEERNSGSCTKHKWMATRDRLSSSSTLGFRIDGISSQDSARVLPDELKRLRDMKNVVPKLLQVLPPPFRNDPERTKQLRLDLIDQIIAQVRRLKEVCEQSHFVQSHEMIGVSLLFVVDKDKAEVHVIDFAKVEPIPQGSHIDHRSPWNAGNHEDGFIYGLENLLHTWERARTAVEDPDSDLAADCCHQAWVRSLDELLVKHGIDTSRFGDKGCRSLEEFAWELYVERSVWIELNSAGHLRRAVGIVKAWILAESSAGVPLVLVDAMRGQPFARKIVMGESWQETLHRALEEFLLIGDAQRSTHFKIDNDSYSYHQQERLGSEVTGYPGLHTLYHTHEVDVHVVESTHPALSNIGLPDGRDFRIAVKFQTVFDTKVRHWRWAPRDEMDYRKRGILVGSPARPSFDADSTGSQRLVSSPLI